MRVTVTGGLIEGYIDHELGVRWYKGIPFAAPPVGDLRWKAPQPVVPWTGVRSATEFGARAMQLPIFGDMNFRASGMSEDCLYLNVWAPVTTDTPLPVLVYFYGGGNVAGDGSEPRYDGAQLARQEIISITVNYRLNVFGFFAHPDLSAEAPYHASGNYGYLDQLAALQWVQANIASFGGDPARVTIAGESAGSISVSAQMASPLAKGLIAGAIGSSGSIMGALPAIPLADAERIGVEMATSISAPTLAALRILPAPQLLEALGGRSPQEFTGVIDGYFLPDNPADIFARGAQAQVPLLVGWNSTEVPHMFLLQQHAPTMANFELMVRQQFGPVADQVLQHYAVTSDAEVVDVATDLSSDMFIGYSTWKWADMHARTSNQPVYRYLYAHPRPPMRSEMGDAVSGLAGGVIRGDEAKSAPQLTVKGAVHSADIEYFMGNLATNTVYAWSALDDAISHTMKRVYVQFVQHATPNGADVPAWEPLDVTHRRFMRIAAVSGMEDDRHQMRYEFLDTVLDGRR